MMNYKSFLLCYITGFSYFSHASAYIWDQDYKQGNAIVKKINNTESALDYLKRFVDELKKHPNEQMAKDLIKIVQTHIDTSQQADSGQTKIMFEAVKEAKKNLKKYSPQQWIDLLNGFLQDDLFPKTTSKALEEHIKVLVMLLTGKEANDIVVALDGKKITLKEVSGNLPPPPPLPSSSVGGSIPLPPPPPPSNLSNILSRKIVLTDSKKEKPTESNESSS
ncbi:MAG: hypothetical protein HYS39_01660, partial [Proteobacteria bacterium]|nr:hypothetical protein [Pseudomonadota bacterium]